MASAADIITYIGVPLALLGVTPILYTYVKTIFIGSKLRRVFATYEIQASINSRLLSGIVEANIPAYQLSLYPRHMDGYWTHKHIDGAKHGASWQGMNWMKKPTEERTLQVRFSDQIRFPQSSINFGDLIFYLGDLGCRTNPDGFWELAISGLHALPGTVLVWEFSRDRSPSPIIVIANPTIEHQGSLLVRFQNIPRTSPRSNADFDPSWVEVPKYANVDSSLDPTFPSGSNNVGLPAPPVISHVRVTRRGVVEKRFSNAQTQPVLGFSYWFTYSLLACTVRDSTHRYNGRPNGFCIRLEVLYLAREAVIPLWQISPTWQGLLVELLDQTKIQALPTEWTEDSASRHNIVLKTRFETLMRDKLRMRSAIFRRQRQAAVKLTHETISQLEAPHHLPLEVLTVTPTIWSHHATPNSEFFQPLTNKYLPTSQEICVAAMTNAVLGERISIYLTYLRNHFEDSEASSMFAEEPSDNDKVAFLAAIIVLESIAEFSPYLAALGDIESCLTKWNPVYLC